MRKSVVLALAVFSLIAAQRAYADPIQVTGGSFDITVEGDRFAFTGKGFEFVSNLRPQQFIPKIMAPVCNPCRTGDPVDFSFITIGEQFAGSGRAEFMGVSYSEVFYLARFAFDTPPKPFPTFSGFGGHFTQPFTFAGTIRAFLDVELTTLAFASDLRGFGRAGNFFFRIAPGVFSPDEPGTGFYNFTETQPVPEPASLLLFGSGVAGLLWRRGRTTRDRRVSSAE
jgi:hypothetical protein